MTGIFIDSANLEHIRTILERAPELNRLFGVPPRFVVVLDANIAVSDLIWKLKRPNARQSALEEVVRAGTAELYAPRWMDYEMRTSTIPKASAAMRLDRDEVLNAWENHKCIITWDESRRYPESEAQSSSACDWKDIPYVELQHELSAIGILSRDKHISAMGGNAISFDFVLSVQRYSRAASVHLTIMVDGVYLTSFAANAIEATVHGLKSLYDKLPPAARLAIFAAAIAGIVHPKSRAFLIRNAQNTIDLGGKLLSALIDTAGHAQEKQVEAAIALHEAEVCAGLQPAKENNPSEAHSTR